MYLKLIVDLDEDTALSNIFNSRVNPYSIDTLSKKKIMIFL